MAMATGPPAPIPIWHDRAIDLPPGCTPDCKPNSAPGVPVLELRRYSAVKSLRSTLARSRAS